MLRKIILYSEITERYLKIGQERQYVTSWNCNKLSQNFTQLYFLLPRMLESYDTIQGKVCKMVVICVHTRISQFRSFEFQSNERNYIFGDLN